MKRMPVRSRRHVDEALRLATVSLGIAMLVAACVTGWQAGRLPAPLREAIGGSNATHEAELVVTGLVSDTVMSGRASGAHRSEHLGDTALGPRFHAVLIRLNGSELSTPVLVRGTIAGDEAPAPGTRIAARGRLREAPPGQRIAATLVPRGDARVTGLPPGPQSALADFRNGLLERSSALPGAGGELLAGLAVGDDRRVSEPIEQAMRTSSLQHLTAVSGSNCALIVAGVLLLGRACRWPRGVRLSLAALLLAVFVLLVTPSGSVIRASAMAFVALAIAMSGRRAHGPAVLCLAVIVLIAGDPGLAVDIGFALSAAASASLLILTKPLARSLAVVMPRPMALAVSVPLAAQIGCQPVLSLLEPSVPTYGVLANLLAEPAAPVATVVGLAACLAGPISSPVADALAWVAWLPAHWVGCVALAVSTWPAATVPIPAGPVGVVVAALPLAVIGGLMVLFQCSRGDASFRLLRRIVAVATVLVVVAVVGILGGRLAAPQTQRPSEWRYASCDIGQGDATLIRARGRHLLLDTGPDVRLLVRCLNELGVERLDALILSHFDRDHDGASFDILDRVDALVVPDTEEAHREPLPHRAAERGIPVRFAAAGDDLSWSDLRIRAFSPRRTAAGAPAAIGGNSGSLGIRAVPASDCSAECISLVALGDLDAVAQSEVLSAARESARGDPEAELIADVVKVSHHGSRDQDARLYASIHPTVALISVGQRNGYGHPTRAALGMLEGTGSRVARTDEQGTVLVGGSPDGVTLWTQR